MRRTLPALVALAAASSAQPQGATPTVVPVEQAPYHVPVFSNEHVTVLNVLIPSQRSSGYHRHALDTVLVLLSDTRRTNQTLGGEPVERAPAARGTVSFTPYGREPLVHTVAIQGDAPLHNVVVELNSAGAAGFSVGTRASGYEQVLDNERVRAWRLVLEPGQSVPSIIQAAPGIRVIVDGGEIVESAPGRADRGMAPRSGEFYWQDAGVVRAVRNVGTTRVELVELELK